MFMQELRPPRESIVDLALLLENYLTEDDEWFSGDQVMDLHLLKNRLKECQDRLEGTLARIPLQGTAVMLTSPLKKDLRRDIVELVEVCMNILQVTQLLDSENEWDAQ
jgi:hypothetical protein